MIDLAKTRFIVCAWPDNRWPVEISWWIDGLMDGIEHRWDYKDSIKKRNVVCARNVSILESALGSHADYEWFVFLDRDVRPGLETTKFLDLTSDIKCCAVEHRSKRAFAWPDSFHCSLWCTSRHVLETIQPPWFMREYNEDGTNMIGCLCNWFRKKALEAGFTIAHGGWAEHDSDGSWCG